MSETQSIKTKIIQLQNLMTCQAKAQLLISHLEQLLLSFQKVDLDNEPIVKNQIYEELRDTVKSIFAYLAKEEKRTYQDAIKIQKLIKKLLITISYFCSAFYCKYHPIGCGQMIRQFLSSQCKLFVPQIMAAAPSQDLEKKQNQSKIQSWVWAKQSSFKTTFFCECIEIIMLNLSKFEDKFEDMRIQVIGQYLRLLYYMDDYLVTEKIQTLCIGHVSRLEEIFQNPSKQIMKDASKEYLEELIQYMTKLLRYCKNDELKKRIQLLGVILGCNMIKMNSIEKKMVGCKIINKFSYEMLYKNCLYITQQYYAEWITKQKFFETIFEDHCQSSLIKASEDTFKLLVKKSLIDKQKFCKFFEILEKADSDLRKAMFRLIDPFRIDYNQIESMNQILKSLRSVQFYDDEFFYFYEGISRYATQLQLNTMIAIVSQILTAHYSKFSGYLTRRRAIQCYAYLFERLIIYKEMDERIKSYTNIAQQFLNNPSESKLIMLKTLIHNLSQSKLPSYYQEQLSVQIIDNLQFIQKCIPFINNPQFKDDLIYFIKGVLNKYKSSSSKKGFDRQIILSSVTSPEIFQAILNISKPQELNGLLQELSNLTKLQQFSFDCIKEVFIRINWKYLIGIKKDYTDMICTHVTIDNPENFVGIQILKYLIFNSEKESVRKGACQLLVEIYTNFSEGFRSEGEVYLVQFMKNITLLLENKFKQYFQNKQSLISAKGCLQLIEQLLLSTEYFGVGSLKAHNSQIPTSTCLVKIYNNSTYGDDVQKIFEKKLPSNKTLYELIVQVAGQFKIGPLDMALEYPNNIMIKYNGLTLEELKLNNQQLNAIRLPQSRCKKQELLIDGQLSSQAKIIFTQMFNKYAPNGFMTTKQCGNYIEGVTLSYCPINDSRISELFQKYDSDKDNKILLEDFLRFYKDCVLDFEKMQTVERNLNHLRYRRDLKTYNAQYDSLNEESLFRYHVVKQLSLYTYLFNFTKSSEFYLANLSQNILLRLPTYEKIIESITDTLDLKEKSSFQIEYMLTALQSHLNNEKDASKQLIAKENHLSIFQYLSILAAKPIRLQNDQNCLIICMHLLRSLLGNFNLRQIKITQFPQLAFKLSKTNVFINIIRESVKNGDSTLLQPAFALQLTQNQLPIQCIQQSAFNRDKDTRILTCNFLFLWLLKNKDENLNLFKISIKPYYNEEWFDLLTSITHLNIQINLQQIFNDKMDVIAKNTENLEGVRFNHIINGSLKIIKQIYSRISEAHKQKLSIVLDDLLPKLISNENRQLVYKLREEYPLVLLNDLESVANIKMGKESQLRNRFVGIKNLGCICYMNSILQQFYMVKQFYNFVMSLPSKSEYSTLNGKHFVDDFLSQMQLLYINLQLSQKQYYDPTTFCLSVKDNQGKPINTMIQQDAHQFLNTTFDKMQKYAKENEQLKVLERIFGGKTVTQIICQTCKNKNQVLQHYYHLSVEVKGMKTLKQSFDKLIQPEEISDYFCVNCDRKVEKITKQTLIKQSPQILIINLQRIIFDLETFLKVKVHTKLQFQQTLDLHSYFSSSTKPAPYKLKGIVIHSGTSQGGHYYSLIKSQDRWYKFNDQSVTYSNQSEIGRESFGGEEVTDQWGQHSSSTNAYILLYERVKENEEQDKQASIEIDKTLVEKVINQNRQFAGQMQFNQQSFFTALKNIYQKFKDNSTEQQTKILSKVCQIYLRVVQHLSINSDIKSQIVNEVKDNLLRLLNLFPLKSIEFIEKLNINAFKDIICTHNDVNIRDIYQKILQVSINNSYTQTNQIQQKAEQIIQSLLSLLEDDLLLKNLHKSYQYFELIKHLVNNNQKVRNIVFNKDILAIFMDLLMGNQSILFGKEKKRTQFHSSQAIPVVSIITSLMAYKKNNLGFTNTAAKIQEYRQLTQKQCKILNQQNFYKKVMKNKLDIGLLAPIISLMSYKNHYFSQAIAQVLIKSMNSSDEIEDKNIIFINMKAFLLVDDEYTNDRIKWIMGIPQLTNMKYAEYQFGLMTSSESKVYNYVSNIFFVNSEKYQPLLDVLYEKRKYFNSFSTYGIITLLELLNQSALVRSYVISLPAPCYILRTYVDWIETFALKVKIQQHFNLPLDKTILTQKLNNLISSYKQKVQGIEEYKNLPVNKKIIGKNAKFERKDFYHTDNFKIDLYVHTTFVLTNRPYGMGNFSLPDDQFSFTTVKELTIAKYFIKGNDDEFNSTDNIQKQATVMTWVIDTKLNMEIIFKIPTFNYKILLKKGNHSINTPYCDQKFQNLLEILEIEEVEQIEKQEEKVNVVENKSVLQLSNQTQTYHLDNNSAGAMNSDYFLEINCKTCTYLNVGRDKCEMCETDLFK